MYFITEKTTKTGLNFKALEEKIKHCKNEVKKIIKPFGISKYYVKSHCIVGGISGFVFEDGDVIDEKLFKIESKKHNSWMPRASNKQGKEILKKIEDLPTVDAEEINMCIGYKEDFLHTIGYSFNNPKYYGFQVNSEWKVKIPKDCVEVTETEYKKLFK